MLEIGSDFCINFSSENKYKDFYYYNKSIKPKEGLTLIWPADWTHIHRGNTVIDTKYIITGMFKYAS